MSKQDGIGTWVWNETLTYDFTEEGFEAYFDFVSNNVNYDNVFFSLSFDTGGNLIIYANDISGIADESYLTGKNYTGWQNESYRTIDIKTAPPAEFLTILQANATYKEASEPTYKLRVNGKYAQVNGKKKGTLTFEGKTYAWDNSSVIGGGVTPSDEVTNLTFELDALVKKPTSTDYQDKYVSWTFTSDQISAGVSADANFKEIIYLEPLQTFFSDLKAEIGDPLHNENLVDATVEGTLQLNISYDNRITMSNDHLSIGNMFGFYDTPRLIFKDIDRTLLKGKIIKKDGSIVDMPNYNTIAITLRVCRNEITDDLLGSERTDDDRLRYVDLNNSYRTLLTDIIYEIIPFTISGQGFTTKQYFTISSTLSGQLTFKFPNTSFANRIVNIDYTQRAGSENNYSGVEEWQDVSATAALAKKTSGTGAGGGSGHN